MMPTLKPTSKKAKEVLAQVKGVKVGDKLELDGFLSGFGSKVTAHCTEVELDKFWMFSLYWNSVHIQDVVVEHLPTEVVVDVLGT